MHVKQHLRSVVEAAISQGWQVDQSKNSHLMFTPPDKTRRRVYTSSTPSDSRSFQNLLSDLRKSGLEFRSGGRVSTAV